MSLPILFLYFFFNDTATTEIYTLSLHDALPIFVQMEMDDESWFVVRNTPGVTGFVSAEDESDNRPKPVPLEQHEVDNILNQIESDEPRVRVGFAQGQTVRITEGPFVDFMGAVDEVYPDRAKVKVLVSFFGRETPVELDFLQVEKA